MARTTAGIFDLPRDLDPSEAVLFPPLLQVAQALAVPREPGWTALVTGRGLRGALLLRLAPQCGARRVVNLESELGTSTSEHGSSASPADVTATHDRLTELLAGARGSVVAFIARDAPDSVLALLTTLPAHSHIVLLESPSARVPVAVNFYRDVHRKNIILHGIRRQGPRDSASHDRVLGLLRGRIRTQELPGISRVVARAGVDPSVGAGSLMLLTWPLA
jgi:threonine dehydrogenase-like Zn-dependent dehydrogenase